MMQFKAFKPQAMNKIAQAMGYQGNMGQFQQYIEQDPARQQQMNMYTNAAKMMAQGGMVRKFDDGGFNPTFYRVPVRVPGGSVDEQTTKKIYIGSEEDTRANRQLGSSSLSSAVQDAGPGFLRANPPYDERPDTQQAVQEQEAVEQITPEQQAAAEQAAAEQAAAMQQQQAAAMQQQQASIQQAANLQNAGISQPIYQAPYLSGIKFTPAGQYVQDPNTMQMIPQAYVPLNPGYGTAGINFQNTVGNIAMPTIPQVGRALQAPTNQNQGGYIQPQNFAVGGTVTNPSATQAATPTVTTPTQAVKDADGNIISPGIAQFSVEQMYTPGVPVGGTTIAAETQTDATQDITTGTGEVNANINAQATQAATTTAAAPAATAANVMQAQQAAPAVDAAMKATQAAQMDPNDPRAQVTAAQQTTSSVGNLQAAQGNASLISNPVQRQIQQGELISGAANAATAAQFTEQIQAAQATPTQQATVQGQLDGLMTQFQGGATPAWAAGAMRAATSAMAARGLGASSLAGQAIVQAAMESALPIAQADAQTQAQFEGQNLSNRQQIAMLAAQQRAKFMGQEFDQAFQSRVQNSARIGDIANMNFTAEQQVQLENSRATNTMNLANLSNSQAMVMAEASALAQLDTSNLSNRQQAAVQNAQSFLQTDMANLSNRQQTDLFKAQQRVQSLFTDQAATNAAAQFNATSQNQTDQFFSNLSSQVSQFNATQANAQAQFNAGEANTITRFNEELNNQRDQFNAQNQLVIAQSNAQWRRQVATADTAAVNRANELNANAILDISANAYNNLWQYYGDTMEYAWKSAEKELDRYSAMAIAELDAKTAAAASSAASSSAAGSAIGGLIGTLGSAWIGTLCWVAREVYGTSNPEWFIFRTWLEYDAPKWFKKLYKAHGKNYAIVISKVPPLKWATKKLMDTVINNKRRKHNVQTV